MITKEVKQSFFDKVVEGLAKQNFERAGRSQGGGDPFYCMYRDDNGRRCAAGQLIPDDKYDPGFEGCRVYDSRVMKAMGITSDDMVNFIGQMQEAHDNSTNPTPSGMKGRLRRIGELHGLNIPDVLNEK